MPSAYICFKNCFVSQEEYRRHQGVKHATEEHERLKREDKEEKRTRRREEEQKEIEKKRKVAAKNVYFFSS